MYPLYASKEVLNMRINFVIVIVIIQWPINVRFLQVCPVTATEIKTIVSLMNKTTCT